MLLRLCLLLNLTVLGFSFQGTKNTVNVFRLTSKGTALDLSSPLFGEDANEEELFGDSERSIKDGEDMAKLFYKEMQRRSDSSTLNVDSSVQEISADTPSPPSPAKSTADLRKLIAETGNLDTATDSNAKDDKTSTTSQSADAKFTGQNSLPPQQPFSRSPREAFLSGNTNAGPRSPREVMMEREYELVGRAERNIGIQAVFAVLALTFYIYIGLSGGISSRLDGPDLGADEMLPFEQMIPTQTDRENTVWL
ncbi:unnamed protein product [Cylindrotheca closterium]|uniref:Uncharacterized protein n=1 Tax=Cylindrotheca closterium TaxID=2856 RepID=A0AAD2GAD2_9STRA|nr:unnamed protein product [Cylindrotheca closterium]